MGPAPEKETDTPGSGDQPQEDLGVEVQATPSKGAGDVGGGTGDATERSGDEEPAG
jgi:hypothetical protein